MGIKLSKVAKTAKKYDHILIIMRHAKAEPFGDKGDSERELTDKGLKQAKAVGKGIESLGLVPDQISCSSATRTRQTLDRMLKTFGDKPIVDYRISLYDGGVQAVFDELAHVKAKNRVFMIVGHEPTVSISAQWLPPPDAPRAPVRVPSPRRPRRRTTRPAEFGTFARVHRDHGIEQTVRRMAGAQRRTARGHQCERLRLKRI